MPADHTPWYSNMPDRKDWNKKHLLLSVPHIFNMRQKSDELERKWNPLVPDVSITTDHDVWMRGDLTTTQQILFKYAPDREEPFVLLSSKKGCRLITHYADLKICFEDRPNKYPAIGKKNKTLNWQSHGPLKHKSMATEASILDSQNVSVLMKPSILSACPVFSIFFLLEDGLSNMHDSALAHTWVCTNWGFGLSCAWHKLSTGRAFWGQKRSRIW